MKCLKTLCLLLLLLSGYQGFAQWKDNIEFNIWNRRAKDTARVYARMANVRLDPDIAAPVLDSLPCGTEVVILQLEQVQDQVKGIYAPWVKIRYNNKEEGYMWLGMLSIGWYSRDDARFLYGIEKITQAVNKEGKDYVPEMWWIRVKALSPSGQLLDEKEFKRNAGETSISYGKLLGDMGLKNTTDILRINFGGEACGIPTDYYYYGWTGNKLLDLPGKTEVGDAGVYYYVETMLFPKEQGGQPDKIIRLSEEGTAEDEKADKNGEPIFKIKKTKEVYSWDGMKAKK